MLRPPKQWLADAVRGGEDWADGACQLDFLRQEGLEPHHRLLDLACGTLRGGLHFIRYLDEGCYVGVDNEPLMVEGARALIEGRPYLSAKNPRVWVIKDFGLRPTGKFDVVWAYSLLTHLSLQDVERCIRSVKAVLKPGGVFYASFNKSRKIVEGPPSPHWEHLSTAMFPQGSVKAAARRAGMKAEVVSGPIVSFYTDRGEHHLQNIVRFVP